MKKTIAVIFGGKSPEHEVSIITAHIPIIGSLEASGEFHVIPIYISKDGLWYSAKMFNDLSFFKTHDWEARVKKEKPIHVSFANGFEIVWQGFRTRKQKIDVAFPAMHGTNGEDGSLMGFLRMAGVPFVGCDVFASAVAMDKVLTKQVVAEAGVPVVPFVWFTKYEWSTQLSECLMRTRGLRFPLFVKPVHLGSSIGISKVKSEEELIQALDVAFHYDNKVLVENAVQNLIEVTLPIIGNDELTLAHIERPLNKTDFFDFKEKYLSGGKSSGGVNSQYSEIPARLDEVLLEEVKQLGEKTYRTLGCSGIARVDFLIDGETKKVYVNEVNTLPGSLYVHNWKQKGISGVELVKRLVSLAEERFADAQKLQHTFDSDILKKMTGAKIQ